MQGIFQNAIIQTHYITADYITIKASKYFNIKILPAKIRNIFIYRGMKKTSNHTRLMNKACQTLVVGTISYQTAVKRIFIFLQELVPNSSQTILHFIKGESRFGSETCLIVLFLFRLLYKRQIMCMPSMSSEYLLDWPILK
jgi:hypothetical protein